MVKLTPKTTPKKATSMRSTLPPVNGLGETDGLCIWTAPAAAHLFCFKHNLLGKPVPTFPDHALGGHEIVGGGGDLAEPDIGHMKLYRRRFRRIVRRRRGDEHPQLLGLIAPDHDHRPVGGYGI